MDFFSQSALIFQKKLTCKLQKITHFINGKITSAKWVAADFYEEHAPRIIVKLFAQIVRLQSLTNFKKPMPLRRRLTHLTPYAAGALAVVALTAVPASAVFQLAQQAYDENGLNIVRDYEPVLDFEHFPQAGAVSFQEPLIASEPVVSFAVPEFSFQTGENNEALVIDISPTVLSDIDYEDASGEVVSIEDASDELVISDTDELSAEVADAADLRGAVVLGSVQTEPAADEAAAPEEEASEEPDSAEGSAFEEVAGTSAGDDILDEHAVLLDAINATASTGVFIWPTEGRLSSLFGPRSTNFGSTRHEGIDINAPLGTPIVAADGGEVVFAGWNGAFGLMVKISHDDGIATLYAHCSELLVSVGDIVSQGQTIALMGRTGRASGVHLHFEVIVDGVPQDPLRHLPALTAQ